MEREQIWRKVLDGERAWLLDVMKCVESFGKRDLTLDEVHAFERHLEFVAHGNYRLQ
jgi:type II restriction enzyme